ncbi:unnamed protein product [Dracunculus medinensis]|uniref:J domain-containing protein n=1 Tax=Dracunculus medinensis TaxID=318479 RepID=A0A0N4U6E8_DRAME|nr:unnamed protein product [Dracunculus medinensis]
MLVEKLHIENSRTLIDLAKYIADMFCLLLFCSFPMVNCSSAEINRHLEMGKEFLSKGLLADALTHYHAAIELEPDNYKTLYLRATVYLGMGKSKAAVPDLNAVLQLKPDFIAARIERGNVLLKQGDLRGAERDFKEALIHDESSRELESKLAVVSEVKHHMEKANDLFVNNDCINAEKYYTSSIEVCQWNAALYERRAKCYVKSGNIMKAISDYKIVSKLSPTETDPYFTLSKLYYDIGDAEESLSQIRGCLKLNPDDEACFSHYKKVKKLVKMREVLNEKVQASEWMECLQQAEKILRFEKKVPNVQLDVFRQTCKCNLHAGHAMEAITDCTEVLKNGNPNDLHALCDRAEAYLLNEQYDEAIEDYRSAVNAHEDSRRAREGLNKAQKMKKQAGKKDYYKILRVKRNANKQTILKAYRKLASQYHPDNFPDEKEKKQAEAKFLDIAAAKEVLTDPEKRAKFDQGEDPLDPEQQQGGFQHPFYGGFPFGGEGFSFKFHFG